MSLTQIADRQKKPQSLAEAQAFILHHFPPVVGLEWVAAAAGLSRILAKDITAPVDLPRFDASAMDGYAIHAADLEDDGRANLGITGLSAAGHPPDWPLARGHAARIFTGAILPEGADRVVLQEHRRQADGRVQVAVPMGGKPHIRRRGEDVRAGAIVLAAGTRLGAGHLALLAALQCASLPVLRPLRVALLSTGDELQEGAAPLARGRIIDSNRPLLRAMLTSLGCSVADLGIVPDVPEALLAVLVEAAAAHDLIITSGGASVGAADHLHRLIAQRGCMEFWRLNIRPGRPVGLGDIDDCPILALPGNPMAAAVGFTLLGRRLIGRLSGAPAPQPEALMLPLAHAAQKTPGRLDVLAARRMVLPDGQSGVVPLAVQGSASLTALSQAEGLILLPEPLDRVEAGALVAYVPFNG